MSSYWIFIVIFFLLIGILINWLIDSSKDFTELIDAELKQKGMRLLHLKYPGIFNVGPFKKIEISIGKPQINDGTIQYERTYFRIVALKTKKGISYKIWAKIHTNWFKETKIEFIPKLDTLDK